MAIFELPSLEKDMLDDLLEEIKQLYEDSEETLIELEQQPEDVELQRSLFRAIHTIKGDLGLVSFDPIIPLISKVEDLLDLLRKGKITYSAVMSDLVLLCMDKVEFFVEEVIREGRVEYDEQQFENIATQVALITPENSTKHEQLLTEAVLFLDPSLKVEPHKDSLIPTVELDFPNELADDLMFFREMMKPIERRSKYWQNRGDRIAKLCLYVNDLANKPIPEEQLLAACYVHDFGMAFISHDLLHKKEPLSADERETMMQHVEGSAQLLTNIPKWKPALEMVRQHHERFDGSGYPQGLTNGNICDGAKLMAIVDSFDALTHARAFATHVKRPIKRAVIEINADSGKLYDPVWVNHFNTAMRAIIKNK